MHSATQGWLSDHGIKEVVVWRGMKHSIGTSPAVLDTIKAADKPLECGAHLNPMNSWSASYDTAAGFAGAGGFMLSAKVPASHIIGCCFTGAGCLNEQEFVVLGGEGVSITAAHVEKVSYPHVSGWKWELG
jgi:hypothetical protein